MKKQQGYTKNFWTLQQKPLKKEKKIHNNTQKTTKKRKKIHNNTQKTTKKDNKNRKIKK